MRYLAFIFVLIVGNFIIFTLINLNIIENIAWVVTSGVILGQMSQIVLTFKGE